MFSPVVIERPAQSRPAMVEYCEVADVLIVLDHARVHRIERADCDSTPMSFPLDPLTPVSRVNLPAGEPIADAATADLLRVRGAVLTAATQLGLAAGATELAVQYAGERQQFGKPIGQFQAVKHLCADMVTKVELAPRCGVQRRSDA